MYKKFVTKMAVNTCSTGELKTIKKINGSGRLAVFFAGLVLSFSLSGQNVYNLNNNSQQLDYLKSMEDTPPQEYVENAKAYRVFAINPVLTHKTNIYVSVGDIVDLQLFEGKNYRTVISSTYTDVNGNFTIILKSPDYPMAYGIITTSLNGKSFFSFSIPELNQEFMSKGSIYSPTDFLIEIDENIDINLKNDYKEIPVETPEETEEEDSMEEGRMFDRDRSPTDRDPVPCTRDSTLKGTDPAIIDLLIVYTPAAEAWANTNQGGINNVIAAAMARTHQVIANQKNGDTMRLVHSALVEYTEVTNDQMSTDLNRLTGTNDGYMDEVHQWRKDYNADIVVLFESYSGVGGLGWVLSDTVRGRYTHAFNTCRVQQVHTGYTSIHEIGHNMGMRHEIDQYSPTPTPLYPYAWGHYWTGNNSTVYGSVMSYTGARAPYFSNPDEIYYGVPTGTANANNAQVFRNTKHIVAFYSEIVNNFPEKPTNVVVSNPTDNGAFVSWDACKNATSYRVYTTTPTGSTNWSTPNPYYTLNNSTRFQPCSTYSIWVAAVNSCNDIVRGDTILFTTKCPTDPTVTTLAATDTTHNSAKLHKTVTANGAAIISEGFNYKEESATTWQTSTNGILAGLTPNTQYKFYAYATTANGTYNGRVLTFKTLPADPCNVPTSLTVPSGNITKNSAVINWNGDANEYVVDYKISANTTWTTHTPNPTTTTVTLSSLTEDTEYNVRIKAICTDNESAYSNILTFKTIKQVGCPNFADAELENLLQLFPNPITNELFIKSELKIEKVELYTLLGSLLISENNFKDKISVSNLSAGVYLLKVYTEKGVVVGRVVKE